MSLRVDWRASVSLVGTVLKFLALPLLFPLVVAAHYGEGVATFVPVIALTVAVGWRPGSIVVGSGRIAGADGRVGTAMPAVFRLGRRDDEDAPPHRVITHMTNTIRYRCKTFGDCRWYRGGRRTPRVRRLTHLKPSYGLL